MREKLEELMKLGPRCTYETNVSSADRWQRVL